MGDLRGSHYHILHNMLIIIMHFKVYLNMCMLDVTRDAIK